MPWKNMEEEVEFLLEPNNLSEHGSMALNIYGVSDPTL